MTKKTSRTKKPLYCLPAERLKDLFSYLQQEYDIIGPTVRDEAIVYDRVSSPDDLPVGWTDQQDNGTYRIMEIKEKKYFHYTVGPTSWKRFLFPPILHTHRIHKKKDSYEIEPASNDVPRYAFIGVKPCELTAIQVQDTVFTGGAYIDTHYQKAREQIFIVATNCTKANSTCFCVSMNSGPQAESGFDIVLTEVHEKKAHYFVLQSGSKAGDNLIKKLELKEVDQTQAEMMEAVIKNTSDSMGRQLNTDGLAELLYDNLTHPHWDKIAKKCMSCGNCTMVCPTCFCSTVEDVTALGGEYTDRVRKWDSCFSMEYSYIHGGSVRSSISARYRQWLTHKLAGWHDQFGMSGCVGCGRCITWCPVGIDITEEATAIRESVAEKTEQKIEEMAG